MAFGSFGQSKELDFLLHFCIKTKVKCVDQGRGLSVFFCSFSFAESKEKRPSAERQSLRAGGWARWLWRARSPPPSAPLGLRLLAKEQYDEDR